MPQAKKSSATFDYLCWRGARFSDVNKSTLANPTSLLLATTAMILLISSYINANSKVESSSSNTRYSVGASLSTDTFYFTAPKIVGLRFNSGHFHGDICVFHYWRRHPSYLPTLPSRSKHLLSQIELFSSSILPAREQTSRPVGFTFLSNSLSLRPSASGFLLPYYPRHFPVVYGYVNNFTYEVLYILLQR